MSQKDIEVILTRQLAGYLSMPIFIVDRDGDLIYYNEPAELILGRRFDETGELPATEWGSALAPQDDAGTPIPMDALPLSRALAGTPAHGSFWIRAYDNVPRHLQVFAFPLLGHDSRHMGAVAIFWQLPMP
jgi:PAS domain-containing protein